MSCARKIFIVFAVVFIIQYSECKLVRRFNYDARLYEHFALDSRFIQYSRTEPDDWKDISKLADTKEFTFTSMICTLGPGAWIFYPEPNYEMGNTQLYYLVVGEHCVRADDIDSIQPLGKMDEILEQGVLLFEKSQFESPHTLITEGDGSGGGGSLIFTGGSSFLIEGGGQKICLRPGLTVFDDGYCLIPNLKASFNIEGTVTVKENCTGEDDTEKKLVVQNCYMNGVHEIYSDQDLTIDKLNEVCSNSSDDDFLKSKFTILMDMWGKRLDDKEKIAPNTLTKENETKIGILWAMLDIFTQSCKQVEDTYVYLLGHLFSMYLKQLWNNGTTPRGTPYNKSTTTMQQWTWTSSFFLSCKNRSNELPQYGGSCKATDEFNRLAENAGSSFTEPDSSWYEIVNGDMFDPVIEQIWLIMNFVLPSCNILHEYMNNDWSEMVVVMHENYLDPLHELWGEPGKFLRIYNAVFHGYDMREEHKNILTCVRGALEASPSYDPIGRPRIIQRNDTYLFQTPDYGKIDKPSDTRPKRG